MVSRPFPFRSATPLQAILLTSIFLSLPSGRCRHDSRARLAHSSRQCHAPRQAQHGRLRRDTGRQQDAVLGDAHPSVRILHQSPPGQGVRVGLWWSHVSSWMLLRKCFRQRKARSVRPTLTLPFLLTRGSADVPPEESKAGRRRLDSDHHQPRHHPRVRPVRGVDPAPEEPAPAGRGSVSVDAHAADVPESQDALLSSGEVPHGRARHLLGPALSATTVDQLDHPQPHGAVARQEPLRNVLLQVRPLYFLRKMRF